MPEYSDLLQGILAKDRSLLARAITCVESTAAKDRIVAEKLLNKILPYTGKSIRIAVTGPPGVGKSTLIDGLGTNLIDKGLKPAVLTIDPSSSKSGGSILGDKTRMENLARSDSSFIRPSPSLGIAGGVAGKTREAILLCEAAGFDIVIVETMGVGQGEWVVHNMVDFFLLVQIAGSGDELQGMKKGIVELADAIVFNKADGDNIKNTEKARQQMQMALHYLPGFTDHDVPVISCSAIEKKGIVDIWNIIERCIEKLKSDDMFNMKRARQNSEWMMHLIKSKIDELFFTDNEVTGKIKKLEQRVLKDEILPARAADEIVTIFRKRYKRS